MKKDIKKIVPIFIFIILLMGMAIFPLIPAYIFKLDIQKFPMNMKIIYELACDIGYMIILYTIYYKNINKDIKEYFKNFKEYFKISIRYYIIGYIIMLVSNIIINLFVSNATPANEEAVRNLIDLYPILMLFQVAFYAPFTEELIFRKSIYDIFSPYKSNKYLSYIYIITSGLIFSSIHVLGISTSPIDYIYIIPYLGLGIAIAAIYSKTKNIFTAITIHSIHNILAIILYLLVGV